MRQGDRVVVTQDVGGPVAVVPRGTPGTVTEGLPASDRWEVRFDNERTEFCRGDQLEPASPAVRPG